MNEHENDEEESSDAVQSFEGLVKSVSNGSNAEDGQPGLAKQSMRDAA